jgi:dTDP-glucose 4,6-dehydratase
MMNPLARDLDHVLEHTPGIWEEMSDARIFITGGTGFFGHWLLESFAWACDRLRLGASMAVLTRSPEAFRAKTPHLAAHRAIQLLEGDVRSFRLDGGRFSHVIHAATPASAEMIREQPLLMLDTIVEGTRHALDLAVATGAGRFLLTSSGAVYGPQPAEITNMPETYPGGPDPADVRSVYGEGKRTAELLCSLYSHEHKLDCVIARGFAFVGPRLPLNTHFAIGNFIRDCLDGRPIQVHGDGTPYRSYLYAADLAVWLWTILIRGQPCRPYNVGSERGISILELASVVRCALGATSAVDLEGTPQPGIPPERYVPSTARAREELGLQEWIPLEEGIRRTAEWASPQITGEGTEEAQWS